MPERPVVLDTHVWIWAVTGDSALKLPARQLITDALKASTVLVPAICVWEVALLCRKQQLQLTQPVHEWIRTALEKPGFLLLKLDSDVAVESTQLPGTFHQDPADCMIVASARIFNAILLTKDARILEYGKAGHVDAVSSG